MINLDFHIHRKSYRLKVQLVVPNRGILGLVGPSGSGKTSILRAIVGLDETANGQISNDSEIWLDTKTGKHLPPAYRRVGMVFQDMRLFPHLSVSDNLDLAAKWGEVESVDSTLLEALELPPLLDRMPDSLSGGEARRVALARALAQAPNLLLMDEPLTGLDPEQKARIIPAVARAIELANIPAVFVSHDPEDVTRLCETFVQIKPSERSHAGDVREFETTSQMKSGLQIPATFIGGHDEAWIGVDGNNIRLPPSVICADVKSLSPVRLQINLSTAFIGRGQTVPPLGFVSLPLTLNEEGAFLCGEGILELPDLFMPPDYGKQPYYLFAQPLAVRNTR